MNSVLQSMEITKTSGIITTTKKVKSNKEKQTQKKNSIISQILRRETESQIDQTNKQNAFNKSQRIKTNNITFFHKTNKAIPTHLEQNPSNYGKGGSIICTKIEINPKRQTVLFYLIFTFDRIRRGGNAALKTECANKRLDSDREGNGYRWNSFFQLKNDENWKERTWETV